MKKKFIVILSIFLLTIDVVKAQSVTEGVKDIYAQRYKSAKATFEKLLAANPNDIQATYWLGQTLIEMNDVPAAKSLYEKSLLASANAPLVIVGMGQVELIQNKINEARQRFEAAITMTGGKKGNDPEILNAVGRAVTNVYNVKEKKGDINFAVQKLTEASVIKTKDNQLLADIYVNLGNALRKARPGEGGGDAYQNYQKAIDAKPDFAVPYWKMASLFNTQRNFELYQQYLEKTIEKDPRFAPAYYDLYFFKLERLDFNNAEFYARKYVETADPDPQNDYLRVQTLYFRKEYNQAITGANAIMSQAGPATNPRVYRLLAYSYVEKGDTAQAKQYIDKFFENAKEEDIVPKDYTLQAMIYSIVSGQEAVVLKSFQDGVKADTSLENKITLVKDGIKFFNGKRKFSEEAQLYQLLFEVKPPADVNLNELFGATFANYRDSNYAQSREYALQMIIKAPEQQFGWEWAFNNAKLLDTVKKDSIAVPDGMNLITFTKGDTVKFARQINVASYFIAIYYNDKKELDSAIKYLKLMKSATPVTETAQRESIQNNIKQLEEVLKKSKSASSNAAAAARKPEG